jgi:hypothetical protein
MTERDDRRHELLKNLIYLYLGSQPYLLNRETTAKYLYIYWDKNKTLCEYPRPDFDLLTIWVDEITKAINEEVDYVG